MSAKVSDFKLGLFVLAGIAVLLAGLFIFGASKWLQGKSINETYLEGDVGGLKTGSTVTLRGVPVGQVTRINFTWNVYHRPEPRYVYIQFEISDAVSLVPPGKGFAEHLAEQIRAGLRARVKSQGLAGATILSLEYVNPEEYPPLPVPWKPRHTYIPSAPSQFTEILSSVDQIAARIKQIDFEKLGQTLQQDLAAGDKFLANLNRTDLSGISSNATALLADLRGVSAQLRAFIGPTNELAQANLPTLSTNADRVLIELQNSIGRLDRILANLDAASLNQTLDNLQRASEQLEETIHKLKRYPSGMLFGEPPPPARSVETPREE